MSLLNVHWRKGRANKSQRRSRSRSSNRSTPSEAEVPPTREESALSFRVDAQAATDAVFSVLHTASDLAPVPGLSTATAIVENIAQLCLNVSRNRCVVIRITCDDHFLVLTIITLCRNEATQLSDDCRMLQKTIEEANENAQGPEYLERKILEFATYVLSFVQVYEIAGIANKDSLTV